MTTEENNSNKSKNVDNEEETYNVEGLDNLASAETSKVVANNNNNNNRGDV